MNECSLPFYPRTRWRSSNVVAMGGLPNLYYGDDIEEKIGDQCCHGKSKDLGHWKLFSRERGSRICTGGLFWGFFFVVFCAGIQGEEGGRHFIGGSGLSWESLAVFFHLQERG
ncbi:hypothetical protein KP509_27G039800 [Ceratopteris richardii]|nr:hypothetical protein KP509_27G039800 [Ceratopteris richardii]